MSFISAASRDVSSETNAAAPDTLMQPDCKASLSNDNARTKFIDMNSIWHFIYETFLFVTTRRVYAKIEIKQVDTSSSGRRC